MQTILGANGQIAVELARELRRKQRLPLRLVSRQPRKVHASDTVMAADLLDRQQTLRAVEGSEIVYFTAGLPPQSRLWEQSFPIMLRHALEAARATGAKFAYFDNTYMYPQDGRVLREQTPFQATGRKGRVRARMADMVLAEMARGDIPVLIARAPEFYGPGQTMSITNTMVFDRLRAGKPPLVPIRDDRRRSLIWTPDASRALALLGQTADAFGHSWHLPCDDEYPSYRQLVSMACEAWGQPVRYRVVPGWMFAMLGLFDAKVREIKELLPRYAQHQFFDASRFRQRFPQFEITSYRQGIAMIRAEAVKHRQRPAAASGPAA